MRHIYLSIIFAALSLGISVAQTTREEVYARPEMSGGVHYAYPSQDVRPQTPAPKGYKPFYITHFGRHGSRYLISDNDYKEVLDLFEDAAEANALTPQGKEVYGKLTTIWAEAEGRGGDLSPLGVREHRGIAERMYKNFPEVFTKNGEISARSTMVVRCVLSMDAFCERLKELNPSLQMDRIASEKYARVLNYHTPEAIAFRTDKENLWRENARKFEEKRVHPDRLIPTLFADKEYIYQKVNPNKVMWSLFNVASNTQNIEADVNLYDIFENEELFALWECGNYRNYVQYGNAAINEGVIMDNPKPVLKEILEKATLAINGTGNVADLRFAHDGNILPLSMLLHLDGCYNSISNPDDYYTAFSNFKISPMGSNIQMIFFRKNGTDDILVKFLHNENETAIPVETDSYPYYHWKDVEAFYQGLLTN